MISEHCLLEVNRTQMLLFALFVRCRCRKR